MTSLHAQFIAQLAAKGSAEDLSEGELEQRLLAITNEGRQAWPDVSLPDEVFVTHLAQRLDGKLSLIDALERLKIVDLYLAAACINKNPAATEIFARDYLPYAEMAVRQLHKDDAQTSDVVQMVCEKLLVGDGQRSPRLSQYSGRGELRSWLRIAATRSALDLLRQQGKRAETNDKDLEDLAAADDNQELNYLKRVYRQQFKEAFVEALSALSSRQRTLLRLQLIDELNIDQIGTIYQAHRSTVARWLAKIREDLLVSTRTALALRLKINRNEFESIVRLIHSQLDVSICRHLQQADDGKPPKEESIDGTDF